MGCDCLHLNADRIDPTRLQMQRNELLVRIRKIMRSAAKQVLKWVQEQKEQGLFDPNSPTANAQLQERLKLLKATVQRKIQKELLNGGQSPVGWWMNQYVDKAYNRGIQRAFSQLKGAGIQVKGMKDMTVKQGTSFLYNRPAAIARRDALDMSLWSQFAGIADELVNKIQSTVLAGMTYGMSPYEVAGALRKTMNLSSNRAQTIARTEITRAHHVANVQTFREAGVEGVKVLAEVLTVAGEHGNPVSSRVCEECWKLQQRSMKKPYTLDEAEKLIPVHPNCRCVIIPVMPETHEDE